MEVLILSKTHFGPNSVCVGGMLLENNRYVRLLKPGRTGGWYQYADTPLHIGQVWDIRFNTSDIIIEPHNEDVIIQNQTYLRTIDNLPQFILNRNVPIWRGNINNIFEGKLTWANTGAGYLSKNSNVHPSHSVGFWLSDRALSFENDHYVYSINSLLRGRKLKYKGIPDAIATIPENTLIRVSLAKWWKPDNSTQEERCYAQLSGWY